MKNGKPKIKKGKTTFVKKISSSGKVFLQGISNKTKQCLKIFGVKGNSKILKDAMSKDPSHFQYNKIKANPKGFIEQVGGKLRNMPAHPILPAGHKNSKTFAERLAKAGITDFNPNSSKNGVIIPSALNSKANSKDYFKKVDKILEDAIGNKTGTEAKTALDSVLTNIGKALDKDRELHLQGKPLEFLKF